MESSFNPLHCGAVVASPERDMDLFFGGTRFNPLHCGAVVASCSSRSTTDLAAPRFNPLHCGAVVASQNSLFGVAPRLSRFNPLHCGAVVASNKRSPPAARRGNVSIPFIAGQWSLHLAEKRVAVAQTVFQSPSLRGSGRFRPRTRMSAVS